MVFNEKLTQQQIGEFIPHRAPFLFLEEAHVACADTVEGVTCWPADHPILAGHFPGMPVVPGVCQIEALAQLAGVLIGIRARTEAVDSPPRVGLLGSVRSASFHCPVKPGQRLAMVCRLRDISANAVLVEGSGRVGAEVAVKSQFLIFLATPGKIIQPAESESPVMSVDA